MTKTCTKCKTSKSLDEFHDDPRGRFGKQSRCKLCQGESTKQWRAESTDASRMSQRKTARKYKAYWRNHNPYEETKTRHCPHCNVDKPSLDFDECHSTASGLQSWCRECGSSRSSTATMLTWTKARAKKNGLEFSLTEADVTIPETCPVLGIPLYKMKGRAGPNSPSLDRIRGSEGYVPHNVRVISYRANFLKNNATVDELRSVLVYMEREAT
jgi:hypothetical protein